LKARPEPTQLECLSDASFLGKLLVLPANVRLDWKVIARYKHSSLFRHSISDEGENIKTSASGGPDPKLRRRIHLHDVAPTDGPGKLTTCPLVFVFIHLSISSNSPNV